MSKITEDQKIIIRGIFNNAADEFLELNLPDEKNATITDKRNRFKRDNGNIIYIDRSPSIAQITAMRTKRFYFHYHCFGKGITIKYTP